jgi:hypothetical protein
MKLDLTQYILINSTWLLAGLLIYFILSLFKVHIIWNIQPKIYNNPSTENLFKDYFKSFFKSLFTGTRLLKATFKYLFHYNEKDFLIIKGEQTKSINKRLNILDGFTTFLKPYLIFAFVWALLEFWISRKLLYDQSKIVLGEIQRLLAFIEAIPFIGFLQKNKGMIFLIYGIICVLIPFLYDREDSAKKYKRYFSRSLIYLSLLANISFFGTEIGKTTANKSNELSELKTEITSLHDSIYKQLVVAIELNDFEDTLQYENDFYKSEVTRFDSLIKTTNNLEIDSSIKRDLQTELAKHLSEIETNSIVENATIANDYSVIPNHGKSKSSSTFFNDYFNNNLKNNSAYSNYAEYMANKFVWNKETGETILNEVEDLTKKNSIATSKFKKKLEKILSYLFDYGFDASITEIFTDFGIGVHKTLKKVVSTIFSENYKKGIVEKIVAVLNSLTGNPKKAKIIFGEKETIYAISDLELNNFRNGNIEFFKTQKLIAENKQLERDISKKVSLLNIEIPDNDKILLSLKIEALYRNEIIMDENDAKEYLLSENCVIDKSKSLSENLIAEEINGLTKNFFQSYSDKGNVAGYNQYLKKEYSIVSKPNASFNLNKLIIGMTTLGICPFCGLPLSGPSPFCPTNFLR